MIDSLIAMKSTYEKQIERLKQEKKTGNVCDRAYKIQIGIWELRIKQYDRMIEEERLGG